MANNPKPRTASAPIRNILVAVPSTGGVIKAKTAETLFQLARLLTARGFAPVMINIDGSDVVTVRNAYANKLLDSEIWDALLFVDSDMAFDPRLVLRMIEMNVGVAGAACTTRELDLIRFHEAMTEHGDAALARAQASRFNVLTTFNNKQTRKIHNRDGFFTLAAVGMAVCLIRKTALKAMVKSGAVDRRVNIIDGVEHPSWGFFDQHNIGATVLLEDYSFCYRWVEKMQRPLWVCCDCTVRHLGDFAYGAAYLPLLQGKLKKSLKFEEIEKPGGAENFAE